MSDDDDDERMDRARRIRRMREGRRDQPEGSDDAAEDVAEATTDSEDRSESEPTANGQERTQENAAEQAGSGESEALGATDSTPDTESESAEIEGPTDEDGWFGDEASQASTESDAEEAIEQESDTDDSGPTESETGEDAPAKETAAAAASAAAAFEVDEVESDATTEQDSDETERAAEKSSEEPEQEEEIRVLEFRLGDEHYCLDIEHVEEIVKEESITRVPNTPEHVHGVVDLRGQITTILDPKVALDIDDDTDEKLIVVFGAETFEDQGHAGWIVDEVRQVLPVTESEVKESPLDRQTIKGVIERDEEFIIWTSPEIALEEAED